MAGPQILKIDFSADQMPVFKEEQGSKDYVLCGENNQYPDHLIDLFNKSGKHNAIVTGVSDMIKGDGFKVKSGNLAQWLESPNQFENANDLLAKVCLDLKLFGGFYLQLVWDRVGKNITQTYHLPFREMRVNSNCTQFYRNLKGWSTGSRKSDYTSYPVFNPEKSTQQQIQVFYYKDYRPDLKCYPLPDYFGARQYIEIDTEISNFHNSNIKSGFSAGTIITFINGEPTEEEQKAIAKKIKGRHQGTGNAGGVVLNFVDKADQAPIIARLQPNELDKQYLQLYDTVNQEIFIGHRVTNPSLFGVLVPGKLGETNNITETKDVFYTDYIKPKVAIVERAFNYFLPYVEQGASIYIEKPNSQDNQTDPNLKPAVTPTPAQPAQMAAQKTEQDILALFDKFGVPESEYRIIKTKRLRFDTDIELQDEFGKQYIRGMFADTLNVKIDDVQAKVLAAIKENPQLTIAEIANLIKVTPDEVNTAVDYLTGEGIIKVDSSGGRIDITDKGLKTIDEKNLISTEIFVKYKYSGPKDNRNRPFCAQLLDKSRLFSRDDIDAISDAAGYNVWTQRGGWYHNPNTDVNTPYCRHFWNQVIVKRKTRGA